MRRAALCLLLLVCGTLLAALRLAEPADLKLLDLQFRVLRAWFPAPVDDDVVVVGIDEATEQAIAEPIALWHRHLAGFLRAMTLARPAAVGIDIVLPDRSFEAVLPGTDRVLMKGLIEARRGAPLVLAVTLDGVGRQRAIHAPFATLAGAEGIGYALFPVDADGIVRRFDERLGERGEAVATLVGQMARRLGRSPSAGYIDFRAGPPFAYIPLHQVLSWAERGDQAALANAFAGRLVLLGMTLPFIDRQRAPVPLAAWEPGSREVPGVLLHAQALRSLGNGGLIQRVPAVAVIALSLGAVLLWFAGGTMAAAVGACIACGVLLVGVSTWLLTQGQFLPVAAPMLTGVIAAGGRSALDTYTKLRERRRLRASFSGYVSPAVMDEILAGRIRPEMGGERCFVCVMFSDIRGYTTRSERMTPEAIIRFLNRYFERTVALIHARGGSVMCFMGDGIMAVFGAPQPLANPCREAFEAARAMLAYVAELNEELRGTGEEPLEIGIGLNAGEAVLGHIGSSTRHDYSAIGDVTNVASRVEGLTKEAGYRIVVTRAVAEQLAGANLAGLGAMAIKGHTPVEVYGCDRVAQV